MIGFPLRIIFLEVALQTQKLLMLKLLTISIQLYHSVKLWIYNTWKWFFSPYSQVHFSPVYKIFCQYCSWKYFIYNQLIIRETVHIFVIKHYISSVVDFLFIFFVHFYIEVFVAHIFLLSKLGMWKDLIAR